MGVKPLLCRHPRLLPEYPSETNVDEAGRYSAFRSETVSAQEDSHREAKMKTMMKRKKSGDDDDCHSSSPPVP
jgi:hypothetical protein